MPHAYIYVQIRIYTCKYTPLLMYYTHIYMYVYICMYTCMPLHV